MSSKSHFFRNNGIPKALLNNAVLWINADNIVGNELIDLTNNNNNFSNNFGSPTGIGLNNQTYLDFNTDNARLNTNNTFNDLDGVNFSVFMVFRLTSYSGFGSLHTLFSLGYGNDGGTVGANSVLFFNSNGTETPFQTIWFKNNSNNPSFNNSYNALNLEPNFLLYDKNNTESNFRINNLPIQQRFDNTQTYINKNIMIGDFGNRTAKMEFYEFAVFDNTTTQLTGNNLFLLETYINNKYGIL